MSGKNPYELLASSYLAQKNAINSQTAQQEELKRQREQAAKNTLASTNRGVYTTYKNAINPYGAAASQGNHSRGVSEYMKNAAYGNMLKGLGAAQNTYQSALTGSNSLWQDYLMEKAGLLADAEREYNSAVIAQQNYDKEKEEEKRRYDQEWAAQQAKDVATAPGGGGSGSGGYYLTDTAVTPASAASSATRLAGLYTPAETGTGDARVVRTRVETSNGKKYLVSYNAAGRVVGRKRIDNTVETGGAQSQAAVRR